ncbi:MAG: GNAT family N-acetyltransferase [Candidatus Neomarinimicrobiota bacterium]
MTGHETRLIPLTRPLARHYASRLLELIGTIPGKPWRETELLQERPHKFHYSRFWLAGDEVAGVIIASKKQNSVHIHQVAIDPAYRRQGLARQAYCRIASQARSDGLIKLTANCILSDKVAVAFHQTLGLTFDDSYIDPDDDLAYGHMSVALDILLQRCPEYESSDPPA